MADFFLRLSPVKLYLPAKMSNLQTKFFLIGMMGAGKSYWAKKLAQLYRVPAFDIDAIIEENTGETIQKIFAGEGGEERFRVLEKKVLRETAWPDACFIACGGGLPCFFDNMDFMSVSGTVIWLNPKPEVLAERLWNQQGIRPLVAACSTKADLVKTLNNLQNSRVKFYSRAQVIVPGNPDEAAIVQVIENSLIA
jgi:shikimate kinase